MEFQRNSKVGVLNSMSWPGPGRSQETSWPGRCLTPGRAVSHTTARPFALPRSYSAKTTLRIIPSTVLWFLVGGRMIGPDAGIVASMVRVVVRLVDKRPPYSHPPRRPFLCYQSWPLGVRSPIHLCAYPFDTTTCSAAWDASGRRTGRNPARSARTMQDARSELPRIPISPSVGERPLGGFEQSDRVQSSP